MDDEPPQYVVQRVRDALARDGRVAELDVRVRVLGRRIYLQGSVTTPERRAAAIAVTREVVPDGEVFDELTVVGVEDPIDEEHLT
jgi:osmotically-inducible protein OsmY